MECRLGQWDTKPDIWILGNTVLMEGIEGCLRDLDFDDLTRWKTINADFDENLKAHRPDLIIFERDRPDYFRLLRLLEDKPGIHLLGIDLECNQALVINSFYFPTRTMSDLLQFVQEIAGNWEGLAEGGNK